MKNETWGGTRSGSWNGDSGTQVIEQAVGGIRQDGGTLFIGDGGSIG